MPYAPTIREEELKNKVAADVFGAFDCTRILGAVDFCVMAGKVEGQRSKVEDGSLLWAEAKAGVRADLVPLFAQLVLTVGKARTFDANLPPPFLGAFDSEKIAFVPYHEIVDLFYQNDFNWSVAPSDPTTREFRLLCDRIAPLFPKSAFLFRFDADAKELAAFVRRNFVAGASPARLRAVTRNNFVFVYQRWAREVKPSIAVNWDGAKKQGILDADFFLADLLSKDNATLVEKLYVVLRGDHYDLDRRLDAAGFLDAKRAEFNDGRKAHALFWNLYRRPPKREYWHYIAERRDLLVPQDVRERKGSFFTPQIWVEKAQEAIADALGENWASEYDVWDCAAGTGNLLVGLPDKYRVWASTLDQADVEVMRERIKNGAALLDSHVFQFDFLNDDFSKLPDGLRAIVQDPERRKKLVVFINPPYAEAASTRTKTGTGGNKPGVATGISLNSKYKPVIGAAANELFALFLIRVSRDIPGCILAQFSKLKHVLAPNFKAFREVFRSKLMSAFLVPASTFDNVSGQFPIGFFIWDTGAREVFSKANAQCFNAKGDFLQAKHLEAVSRDRVINTWLHGFFESRGEPIGWLRFVPSDFQNNSGVYLTLQPKESDIQESRVAAITKNNFLVIAIYIAVRHCIDADWLNDRDQFLWPVDSWRTDYGFQLDCLVFTLFHGQNRISCQIDNGKLKMENGGRIPAPQVNHWIPFTESEVGARDCFQSHFMAETLGKLKTENGKWKIGSGELNADDNSPFPTFNSQFEDGFLFAAEEAGGTAFVPSAPRQFSVFNSQFSIAAASVMDAGRRLWCHYHAQPGALPDASFYDIRAHFQGFNAKGHMNPDSADSTYSSLIADLRAAMKALAAQITPKVYTHGFLK